MGRSTHDVLMYCDCSVHAQKCIQLHLTNAAQMRNMDLFVFPNLLSGNVLYVLWIFVSHYNCEHSWHCACCQRLSSCQKTHWWDNWSSRRDCKVRASKAFCLFLFSTFSLVPLCPTVSKALYMFAFWLGSRLIATARSPHTHTQIHTLFLPLPCWWCACWLKQLSQIEKQRMNAINEQIADRRSQLVGHRWGHQSVTDTIC